jgi:hypothetical protein
MPHHFPTPTFSPDTLSHFMDHFLKNPQFAAQKPQTAYNKILHR